MRPGRPKQGHQGNRSGTQLANYSGILAISAAWAGRIALLVPVVAAPWFIGAVEAWAQVWVISAVLIALGCAALYLVLPSERKDHQTLSAVMLPLLLAVGLGCFQLMPVSRDALARISPKALSIADEFLPSPGSAEEIAATDLGAPRSGEDLPASVCPESTRRSLAHLILATSVFFLAFVLLSGSGVQLWLCGLIAVNGAAVAFFGLAQSLTWNGHLYWSIVLTQGGGPFGPFVNRNNAGGYLLLCLAAAIGVTLWCLAHYFRAWDSTFRLQRRVQRRTVARAKLQILSAVANLNARTLTWLTISGLLVAAICCTLSRGAVVAMLGAVFVTLGVMVASQRRGLSVIWPVLAATVGIFLVVWVGLSDEVGARLATLFEDETYTQGRTRHWQTGLEAAGAFWKAGSGLGTYRFVYAEYQDYFAQLWFRHAENVFLEILVEAGVVGLTLSFITLALVGWSVWRLLTRGRDLTTLAFAVTGVFALAGQTAASLSDFGLLIPANFMLFALMCGSFVGCASQLQSRRFRPGSWVAFARRGTAVLLSIGLMAGCAWSIGEIRPAIQTEKALRDVRLAGPLRQLDLPKLARHIEDLTAASRQTPNDVELHRRLAELWMQRYQREMLSELSENTAFAADDPRLLQLASPILLHRRAWLYTRSQMTDELDSMRESPVVRDNLIPALKHLLASRQACPLLPEVHCGIAQLWALAAPVEEDQIHIDRTRRLAPGDPDLLYICGILDNQAGRIESALASWKASLTLSSRYLDGVLELVGGIPGPNGWISALPDSPQLLVRLARNRFDSVDSRGIRNQLLARAEDLLPEADLPEADRFFLEGSIEALLREDYPVAIDRYTEAVALRASAVDWRYELARLLQQQGHLEEARDQAKRCARLAPRQAKYEKLLHEIHDGLQQQASQADAGQPIENRES